MKISIVLVLCLSILTACEKNTEIEETFSLSVEEPTVEEEIPTLEEAPTLEEEEPTIEDVEPTLEEEEPTIEDVEPTLEEEEPTIEDVEPTLEEEATTLEEVETPHLVEEEPIIEEEQILAEDDAPIVSNISDDIWTAFNKIISTARTRGTQGEITARDYLKSQLELANFSVEYQSFDFYEQDLLTFSNDFFDLNPYSSQSLGTAYNIIAQKDFDPSKKTLIFSAHYDTTLDSIGAFDNGSGTAVLLEATKLISTLTTNLDYNIRIIFFSCEEYLLTGSRHYVNNLTQEEKANIIGCFNLDMVGNSIARTELYYGNINQTSNFVQELLRIAPQFQYTNLGSSDDYSFYKSEIPAFTMTTSNHRHSDFNSEVLGLETDNKYITEEFLIKDANTVFNFMKNFDTNIN